MRPYEYTECYDIFIKGADHKLFEECAPFDFAPRWVQIAQTTGIVLGCITVFVAIVIALLWLAEL